MQKLSSWAIQFENNEWTYFDLVNSTYQRHTRKYFEIQYNTTLLQNFCKIMDWTWGKETISNKIRRTMNNSFLFWLCELKRDAKDQHTYIFYCVNWKKIVYQFYFANKRILI